MLAASCADEGAGEPDDSRLLAAGFVDEYWVGDEPSEREFSDITSMAFSPDGDLAVLDSHEYAVSVFDRGGHEIARWGNEGEGPGEFAVNPFNVAVSNDGMVAVDNRTRVHLFTLDGVEIESRNLGGGWITEVMFDGTGTLVVGWRPTAGSRGFMEPTSEQTMRLDNGEVLWTSPQLNALSAPEMWAPHVVQAGIGAGRIVVGMSNSYQMAVLAVSDGSELGRIGRNVPARGPSDEFTDNLRRILSEAADGSVAEVFEALPIAETYPMIGTIFVGPPDRAIWVERLIGVDDSLAPPVGESMDDWTYRLYDLFDGGDYEYIGTVEIPKGIKLMASDGERVAGVHRNELDVESVRVLRVVIER